MKQERQYKRGSEAAGQAGANGHRYTASSQLDFMRDHRFIYLCVPRILYKDQPIIGLSKND